MPYYKNQSTSEDFLTLQTPIDVPPEAEWRMSDLFGNAFLADSLGGGGDICFNDPFSFLGSPAPEGGLTSATADRELTLDRMARMGTESGDLDPLDDTDMAVLVAIDGGDRNASDMSTDERLKFLANSGRAPNLIPARHAELMKTDVPPEVKASLLELDQDVHNPFDLGSGDFAIDEYSVILKELPDGMTPDEFVDSFLASPNGAVGDDRLLGMDFFNEFHAKSAGSQDDFQAMGDRPAPDVGDWYHIDIPGHFDSELMPANNGDVMLVDRYRDEAHSSGTVQTMTDDQMGPLQDHPVSGRRQFGMDTLPDDAGYRFYTRGFDRTTNSLMDNDLIREMQHQSWSAMMEGMANTYGGHSEHVDENGKPAWGWHEKHSGEELLGSGVQKPWALPCDLDTSGLFGDLLPDLGAESSPVLGPHQGLGPLYDTPQEDLGPSFGWDY